MLDLRIIIDRARAKADLSVNGLAKLSGVPQRTLADWLCGKSAAINSAHIERLFAAIKIEIK